MSSITAVTLGVVLLVAAFVPLVLAYKWPLARIPVAGLYAFLFAGLTVHYAGVSFGEVIEAPKGPNGPQAVGEPSSDELLQRCNQALVAAEQGALILDRSNPRQLVVDATMWSRLPDEIKQAITRCTAISASEPEMEVEVVER